MIRRSGAIEPPFNHPSTTVEAREEKRRDSYLSKEGLIGREQSYQDRSLSAFEAGQVAARLDYGMACKFSRNPFRSIEIRQAWEEGYQLGASQL